MLFDLIHLKSFRSCIHLQPIVRGPHKAEVIIICIFIDSVMINGYDYVCDVLA